MKMWQIAQADGEILLIENTSSSDLTVSVIHVDTSKRVVDYGIPQILQHASLPSCFEVLVIETIEMHDLAM